MSASIRFLGVAVLAWAGVRAASLGLLPGTESWGRAAEAATPPASPVPLVTQTEFGPIEPPAPPSYAPALAYGPTGYTAYPAYAQPVAVPYYYPVPAAAPRSVAPRLRAAGWSGIASTPEPLYYGPGDPEPAPMTRMAAAAQGSRPVPPASTPATVLRPKRFDRLELTAWALLRGSPGPGNLATGGTLGGSQVGARLTYNFNRSLSASLRSSSSVGGVRYAEVAAGLRWKPLAGVPVAVTVERRQALNRWGGRNAFAAFVEGGLYQRPMFARMTLDAYAQAGVVGMKSRDYFIDGGATLTRPVWKNVSAGFGVWGGAQPGLYRMDAGPRVSMNMGRGIRVHADYRQRLMRNAMPSSGPALTIAGDF